MATVSAPNPRKLVRPALPAKTSGFHRLERRLPDRDAFHADSSPTGTLRSSATPDKSVDRAPHAETFYLQKQAQSQTLMVFVLDDGEQIAGYIEWYDKDVIKVRHGCRTLIYKSSIKYLYKAEENVRI